jgi:uncharacterized SAM-binding protein YcdF (DUF218 family)
MYWHKKSVTFWLMPLQAGITLMVVGILLGRCTRWVRSGRGLLLAGLLVLIVTSNRQVGFRLLRPLESQYPPVPELSAGDPLPADLAACRLIVILGGGQTDFAAWPATSKLSPYALGRMVEGVRLARLLPEAKLITTGPGRDAGSPTHARMLAAAAESLGVAPARFSVIETARDTEGEAAELFRRIGPAPFALVTSAWHMPRAMALMRQAGLHPLACPADFHARANDRFDWSDWEWGLEGLQCSTWAIYERLGMAWAGLRGKI